MVGAVPDSTHKDFSVHSPPPKKKIPLTEVSPFMATALVNHCRSTPRNKNTTHQSQYLHDDYTLLGDEDSPETLYLVDRQGEKSIGMSDSSLINDNNPDDTFICPPFIDEMMDIVRRLREQRSEALTNFRFSDPVYHPEPPYVSSSSATAVVATSSSNTHRSIAKSRANNYDDSF